MVWGEIALLDLEEVIMRQYNAKPSSRILRDAVCAIKRYRPECFYNFNLSAILKCRGRPGLYDKYGLKGEDEKHYYFMRHAFDYQFIHFARDHSYERIISEPNQRMIDLYANHHYQTTIPKENSTEEDIVFYEKWQKPVHDLYYSDDPDGVAQAVRSFLTGFDLTLNLYEDSALNRLIKLY